MNLDRLMTGVCSIAKEAGSFLKSEIKNITKNHVEYKSEHDFVTYVDKTSEKFLIRELTSLFPEAGIIAEESQKDRNEKQYNWIIDPLDGTTNYIHGLAPYAVSIALTDFEKEILGVVYEVSLDECFSAHIQGPAYLNNEIIKVSDTAALSKSFIATGFPCINYSKLPEYIELLKAIMFYTHGVRRLGSAATDIAYVACGRFDMFYEYNLGSWDVAAGSVIVKQAGGKVSDFSGGTNYLFGKEIITSNSLVHEEFMNLLQKYFDHA